MSRRRPPPPLWPVLPSLPGHYVAPGDFIEIAWPGIHQGRGFALRRGSPTSVLDRRGECRGWWYQRADGREDFMADADIIIIGKAYEDAARESDVCLWLQVSCARCGCLFDPFQRHLEDRMTNDALTKIEAARTMISDLNHGRREWIMSIPARPDDPDLVLSNALDTADQALRLRDTGWTPVGDDTPALNQDLLITYRHNGDGLIYVATAWYLDDGDNGRHFMFYDGEPYIVPGEVLAWRYYPAAYEPADKQAA